jgi:hypothetical protein
LEVTMQPSPAEVARTLAAGRLPGTASVACRPGPLRVRHATDPAGRPMLLARAGGGLAEALRPAEHTDDTAVVVRVEAAASAPALGRLFVGGWAAPLAGVEARAAALEFAAANPASDLLDLGRGQLLYRVEVAEVRLARPGIMIEIDPDDYAAASPDPHLLAHLLQRQTCQRHGHA